MVVGNTGAAVSESGARELERRSQIDHRTYTEFREYAQISRGERSEIVGSIQQARVQNASVTIFDTAEITEIQGTIQPDMSRHFVTRRRADHAESLRGVGDNLVSEW